MHIFIFFNIFYIFLWFLSKGFMIVFIDYLKYVFWKRAYSNQLSFNKTLFLRKIQKKHISIILTKFGNKRDRIFKYIFTRHSRGVGFMFFVVIFSEFQKSVFQNWVHLYYCYLKKITKNSRYCLENWDLYIYFFT